ncbi:MAG TPA: hypothetical protein VKU02_17670, partial [Gemmataceae bacterium]|nr:hypothetical protein [Gemmataceae bacterium]
MRFSLLARPQDTQDKNQARRPQTKPALECLEDRCSPSSIIDLGTLGGYNSNAWAINNSGTVIGDSFGFMFFNDHAYTYNTAGTNSGAMTDMGTLAGMTGGFSEALAINDAGQIVGASSTANGNMHAFLFSNGTMTDLGTLGGSSSTADAVNNLGGIAGYATTANGQEHAFAYSGGV